MSKHTLHIMVVDDEPDILVVYDLLFASEGHEVETFTDAQEALQAFRSGEWDIIFTDRVMPNMDGEEFATEVKKIDSGMPVIMVTGHAPRGCCTAVDVLISKPFDLAKLQRAMEKAMIRAGTRH